MQRRSFVRRLTGCLRLVSQLSQQARDAQAGVAEQLSFAVMPGQEFVELIQPPGERLYPIRLLPNARLQVVQVFVQGRKQAGAQLRPQLDRGPEIVEIPLGQRGRERGLRTGLRI